jgi:RNase adapter protein RapZ
LKLTVVTGLSGAGKSVAMHALEDLGYYCVDNLPVSLLLPLAEALRARVGSSQPEIDRAAVGIDARSPQGMLSELPESISALRDAGVLGDLLFFEADDDVIIERFSETRRKHPLTRATLPLAEAIRQERTLLSPIKVLADVSIDTSRMHLHQLRDLIWSRIDQRQAGRLSILFLSFGYKHGLPHDADMVFDVRCLPNPHWEPALRSLTGQDREVVEYLDSEPMVAEYLDDMSEFLARWVPRFEADNRAYLTIAVGCTGGRHRSVYMVEKLAMRFSNHAGPVITRHRELA